VTGSRLTVPAAHSVVVEHLRRQILLGTYAPGDKLPPEREHSGRLGVSRVTLREAVRVLEREGLVEVRRGSMGGTVVRHASTSGAQLRRKLHRRLDEVMAIQEFRLAIEPLAAARAAERRTVADIDDLRRSIDSLSVATTIGSFRRADSRFHLMLARCAECPPLVRAVEDARMAMFELFDAFDAERMISVAIEGHTSILEAVEASDAEAAREAMSQHVEVTAREAEALVGSQRQLATSAATPQT
jgi:DNA-binding FadR family transcriptional regulator